MFVFPVLLTSHKSWSQGKSVIPNDTSFAHGNQGSEHPPLMGSTRVLENPRPALSIANNASIFRTIANLVELAGMVQKTKFPSIVIAAVHLHSRINLSRIDTHILGRTRTW